MRRWRRYGSALPATFGRRLISTGRLQPTATLSIHTLADPSNVLILFVAPLLRAVQMLLAAATEVLYNVGVMS